MTSNRKCSIKVLAVLALIMLAIVPVRAAHAGSQSDAQMEERTDSLDGPTEPSKLLSLIDERRSQRDSLLSISPLGRMRDETGVLKKNLYDKTGIKLGAMFSHVFQGVSDSIGNEDKYGTSSVLYLLGSWDLLNKGKPNMGQLVFTVEGRWDYGTTGPEDLGTYGLGSAIGTADTFSKYSPAFLLRELYWRQGSPEAGWAYRFGKITPDAILSSSEHLSPYDNFLPSGSTGPFAIALPDSGLGAVGAWYLNDRMTLAGLISDANADRFDFGDPDQGDLFVAGEFHFKVAPQTPKAGFSKITLWHTDGTKNGLPANGENGPSGWGYYVKLEQELTADGRLIGILRYGKSYNDSAAYDQQGSAHLLLYEPRILTGLKNDLVGIAFNWARLPQSGTRDEYHAEVFYRFPIFPSVDTTLSYQSVIHPATTREIDHASVFSLRIKTVF
jgi:porin